jgi:hypothetical protein
MICQLIPGCLPALYFDQIIQEKFFFSFCILSFGIINYPDPPFFSGSGQDQPGTFFLGYETEFFA